MRPGPYFIWGLGGAVALVVAGVYLARATTDSSDVAAAGDRIELSAVLGGRNLRNAPGPFVGGEISAFMGGVELDFRDAVMQGDEAVIDVFIMMGGIQLRIPENWVVVDNIGALMGGVQDSTRRGRGRGQRSGEGDDEANITRSEDVEAEVERQGQGQGQGDDELEGDSFAASDSADSAFGESVSGVRAAAGGDNSAATGSDDSAGSTKRLVLRGTVLMGGLDIKN